MIATLESAYRDGNFALLQELYVHGVMLHLPSHIIHSRALVIAHDQDLHLNKKEDSTFEITGQWRDASNQFGFTCQLGARRFAIEWRTFRNRVVEVWQSEARAPEPMTLPATRLQPPFDVVHGFGQLAPPGNSEGSEAVKQLHDVWNCRDLRPLARSATLQKQTANLLARFPHLTATLESELTMNNSHLLRWHLQASSPKTIVDLFAFSVWNNGVWMETYLDEAVLEAQLDQPALTSLSAENF